MTKKKKKKSKMIIGDASDARMQQGIAINGGEAASIAALGKVVCDILDANVENETKRCALETLRHVFSIEGVSISHCHVKIGGSTGSFDKADGKE